MRYFTRVLLYIVSLALINILPMTLFSKVVAASPEQSIRLATTTSTYNSGLIDYLLLAFNKSANIEVQVVAVGTGQALRMGANGDVDVVLTHAPEAEAEFVAAGFGIEPRRIMQNDFIIVGPYDDPVKLMNFTDVSDGIEAIFSAEARFISRGDDSGTHKKELQLWDAIKRQPNYINYLESGRGMGHTLQMASELQAYTLTDRGTWLALQDKLHLQVVLQSDPRLLNPYQIILVNPEHHAHVKTTLAREFVDWLASDVGQQAIGNFTINGEVLFMPTMNTKKLTNINWVYYGKSWANTLASIVSAF